MMLVLLSGNSAKTKEWITSVERELKELFDSTHVHHYRHWETGEKTIDIDYELNELSNYLKNKKDYIIFGKSAGVALASKGISKGKIYPKKCMFVGTPLHWCNKLNIPLLDWIKDYKIQQYFIQKTKDPYCEIDELRHIFFKNNIKNPKLIEIDGCDHHYENLKELKKLMRNLINENNL